MNTIWWIHGPYGLMVETAISISCRIPNHQGHKLSCDLLVRHESFLLKSCNCQRHNASISSSRSARNSSRPQTSEDTKYNEPKKEANINQRHPKWKRLILCVCGSPYVIYLERLIPTTSPNMKNSTSRRKAFKIWTCPTWWQQPLHQLPQAYRYLVSKDQYMLRVTQQYHIYIYVYIAHM